ncbi:hypothetical protein K470DRAFT_255477 [Piedraia hortae CBS 480.64]|uniref:Uncharacterized protein n=1 Tax=Piedraia hortae CBS 480.64 TaxID=1314780 RepID=A0A6A7C6G1_9PEZI|nr:hypothetical protein K470DRAFT_255477 [Piedraia hortae CBS 480.64]
MKGRSKKVIVKPSKSSRTRNATKTTKNHRFKPFSDHIAGVKIDPLRRARNVRDHGEPEGNMGSYFERSLEEWRDTNLSETFTTFAKRVAPLCKSLPAIVHHEDEIMKLLMEYISQGDELAMEPLLSLMAHFAHDLNARFHQKYYKEAVQTVAQVAAKHHDPAVLEWSFTCLAWLFKYLSRLLVPDLVPLYDIMSPYLGMQMQRPFIVRFAAESMAFLFRKAAARYDRDPQPLDSIISHIFKKSSEMIPGGKDASSERKTAYLVNLHSQGIMTLLVETIKGVQSSIDQRSGVATVNCLLKASKAEIENGSHTAQGIVIGTLTSLIHHTTIETFQPIFEVVKDFINHLVRQDSKESAGQKTFTFAANLLFTMAAVRKGSRISDWKTAVDLIISLMKNSPKVDPELASAQLSALATILTTTSTGVVIDNLDSVEILMEDRWSPYFLRFSDMVTRLLPERYIGIFCPLLMSYVRDHPTIEELGTYLPRLRIGQGCFHHREPLQAELLHRLKALQNGDTSTPLADSVPALYLIRYFSTFSSKTKLELQTCVLAAVERALRSSQDDEFVRFALCFCLDRLLDISGFISWFAQDWKALDLKSLWPQLCAISERYIALPAFWRNLERYVEYYRPEERMNVDLLHNAIVKALAMPSHEIRKAGLAILMHLYAHRPEILTTAHTIEGIPISMESSRLISMHIRNLGPSYTLELDEVMKRAIPAYCFGLLHLQLSSAWEDSCASLSEICRSKEGEEEVMKLVQTWLEGTPGVEERSSRMPVIGMDAKGFQVTSDFECPNLAKVSAMREQVFGEPRGGYPSSEEMIEDSVVAAPVITPASRGQALRVLSRIPHIAEKRSRVLVPVLLRWASIEDAESEEERWSRKDQKAMLAIFAKFTNPRTLFKANEVYRALLKLCANGDVEIQRSALQAILSWKDAGVAPYQEHMVNLLDGAKFREEISVFLVGSSEGDDGIRAEDQAKLMPILLPLLYGRAVAGSKHGHGADRRAIFMALSRFDEGVLEKFINIAIPDQGMGTLRKQLGMLNMFSDLLGVMGSKLESCAPKMLHAILPCIVNAEHELNTNFPTDASLLRSIRQTGFQCLFRIYGSMEASFPDEAALITQELIKPRLPKFAAENAHSISGILRLFAAWTSSSPSASYLNPDILSAIADLLCEPSAKDDVRVFILQNLLDPLLHNAPETLNSHISDFAASISFLLKCEPAKDVLNASVHSFPLLAAQIQDVNEAISVLQICTSLLIKPSREVSPSAKADILRTLLPLLELEGIQNACGSLFESICGLFSRLSSLESRALLSQVLATLFRNNNTMQISVEICLDLNAQDGTKLNTPNFQLNERGFARISREWRGFTLIQWKPIVHNLLFFLRDTEEAMTRQEAALALSHFLEAEGEGYRDFVAETIMPSIARGVSAQSEVVRNEHVQLLGRVVWRFSDWGAIKDMLPLTVENDDEASVFTNILHIQTHRRLRALRRLADAAEKISSGNVAKFWLPLVENFVFDPAEGDSGRTLADQSVITIGALGASLNWQVFRATFRRYIGFISKMEMEKVVLRVIGALVDAMPKGDRSRVVTEEFLPPLLAYVHHTDESTVDRRMPVAVSIVKLMLLLPEDEVETRLTPLLTDVCQVLRSKAQEARDEARKTLATILSLLGPAYLTFVVRELKRALQRGYQLHVLSFTVHSLLVKLCETCQPGDLDPCLSDLMSIVMDDIFGTVGQEKDAEEYKSAKLEVKAGKSFNTIELLAKFTPVGKLWLLVKPICALLGEKLDSRMLNKIDEVLSRLRKGIDQNAVAGTRDILVFSHEIIRGAYNETSSRAQKEPDAKARRFLIKQPAKSTPTTTSSQQHKLVAFALNLIQKTTRRHPALLTASNMSAFLPVVGDALVEGHEDVKIASMKLLSTLLLLPLPELEPALPVYASEAVATILGSPSMSSPSARAGLELLTSLLREKSYTLPPKKLAQILKTLSTSLDSPDDQGMVYKFLRTVLSRKIVTPEVYECMDTVGEVAIVNPDAEIRASARSVYTIFILNYPMGSERWKKCIAFLTTNLSYNHASGRISVMEVMHTLLGKLSGEEIDKLAFTLFVSLQLTHNGDSEEVCRDMAGALIGKVYTLTGRKSELLDTMREWMGSDNTAVRNAAVKTWMALLRTVEVPIQEVKELRHKLEGVLSRDGDATALETLIVLVETYPEIAFAREAAPLWKQLPEWFAEGTTLAARLTILYLSHFARRGCDLAALPLSQGGLEITEGEMRMYAEKGLLALPSTDSSESETVHQLIVFLGKIFSLNGIGVEEPLLLPLGRVLVDETVTVSTKEAAGTTFRDVVKASQRAINLGGKDAPQTEQDAPQAESETDNLTGSEGVNLSDGAALLRPLLALTSPVAALPGSYKPIVALAHEILDLLRTKATGGAEGFNNAMRIATAQARERRDERRQKRRIEAVTDPVKVGELKRRKREREKNKKREKNERGRGRRRGY